MYLLLTRISTFGFSVSTMFIRSPNGSYSKLSSREKGPQAIFYIFKFVVCLFVCLFVFVFCFFVLMLRHIIKNINKLKNMNT